VGVRSVAAGIRYRGRVIAELNVSANAARLSVEELRDRCAPMVIEHAVAISAEIATR
jgi:IclR family transcriptional regulator, pca regulon regulatory protein